jgi:hypothetical protein
VIGSSTERKIFAEGGPRVIGWREWVGLPDLGVKQIKAKVDTGARTSSLHAFDLERFRRRKKDWVRFVIHPLQRDVKRSIVAEAVLLDERAVKSSSGHAEVRAVILTTLSLGPDTWEIELTLTNRDAMGFRMLLGRQAIKSTLLVDPGRSYLRGKRKKKRLRPPP